MGSTDEAQLSIFLIVCGILGMLLLAVAIIVFVLIYQKRLLAQKSKMQMIEVEHQKDLLQYNVQAQEDERKRIANELHDGIGSLLSATRLFLHQLSLGKPKDQFDGIHAETVEILDDVIGNVRTITRDLLPPGFEKSGLLNCINDLVEKIIASAKIPITFTHNEIERFDTRRELAVYRIIQELLNNTIKYANATKVAIDIQGSEELLEINYWDNGKGFDYKKEETIGLGLRSIESRVSYLEANAILETEPGEGMKMKLQIDIKNKMDQS